MHEIPNIGRTSSSGEGWHPVYIASQRRLQDRTYAMILKGGGGDHRRCNMTTTFMETLEFDGEAS